jgi:hypothetical protein
MWDVVAPDFYHHRSCSGTESDEIISRRRVVLVKGPQLPGLGNHGGRLEGCWEYNRPKAAGASSDSLKWKPWPYLHRNTSVTIDAGEKVGLVGLSGSGKSTFANLVLRLFDVVSGRILIDGQDIVAVTRNSLRESIAMIPQETSLFHRTIRENILWQARRHG